MSSQDKAPFASAISSCRPWTPQMVCLSSARAGTSAWMLYRQQNTATLAGLDTPIQDNGVENLLRPLKLYLSISTIEPFSSGSSVTLHKENKLAFSQVWELSSDKQQRWLHLRPYPEWCPTAESYWVLPFERSHLSLLSLCRKSRSKGQQCGEWKLLRIKC